MSVLKIMTMAELTTKDVDMKYARIDAKRKLEMQKKKIRSRRSCITQFSRYLFSASFTSCYVFCCVNSYAISSPNSSI